jgi:hypothetical protein
MPIKCWPINNLKQSNMTNEFKPKYNIRSLITERAKRLKMKPSEVKVELARNLEVTEQSIRNWMQIPSDAPRTIRSQYQEGICDYFDISREQL